MWRIQFRGAALAQPIGAPVEHRQRGVKAVVHRHIAGDAVAAHISRPAECPHTNSTGTFGHRLTCHRALVNTA
jgi:hypothetical protein